MLRLADEEVSLWSPEAGFHHSILVAANDRVIAASSEGVVMARLENLLGVEKGLVELSPEAHATEGHSQDPGL
jgi:hypothetical protein